MRIFVNGVTGQVGAALIDQLGSTVPVIPASRQIMDIGQLDTIQPVLDELRPDVIVSAAAYTAVDKAESEPELAQTINARAPGEFAKWASRNDVPLIHLSTDYVFDGSGVQRWRESSPTAPLSVYGQTKLEGEEAISRSGCLGLVIRTSWVYASEGKNFLTTIGRLARERRELRVVADQIGAPTSAALIAGAIARLLDGGREELIQKIARARGLLHLSASGETSWYLFARAIVEGLRRYALPLAVEDIVAISSDEYPVAARRPRNSRLDLDRLRTEIGIQPATWQQALDIELDKYVKAIQGNKW